MEVSDLFSPQCYHVPYSSLTMFLGGSQRDRDSATAYRKCLHPMAMKPRELPYCVPGAGQGGLLVLRCCNSLMSRLTVSQCVMKYICI